MRQRPGAPSVHAAAPTAATRSTKAANPTPAPPHPHRQANMRPCLSEDSGTMGEVAREGEAAAACHWAAQSAERAHHWLADLVWGKEGCGGSKAHPGF